MKTLSEKHSNNVVSVNCFGEKERTVYNFNNGYGAVVVFNSTSIGVEAILIEFDNDCQTYEFIADIGGGCNLDNQEKLNNCLDGIAEKNGKQLQFGGFTIQELLQKQ